MGKLLKTIATVITLLAYQVALFADTSRVVVACWCRQAGKDFTTACKAVTHAIETRQDWYIVSLTQRQADATFAKCKRVAEAYKKILLIKGRLTYSDREYSEYDRQINHHFRCTAHTLHLPGGGSVTALPGRDPDTLAGLTGNVIFTEFGLFPGGGYAHWRVIFPLTTRGYQIIVISTPRGKNTKFHELVNDPETYSVHIVDIHQAVADGMVLRDNNGKPITIEQFRKIYGDEVGWQREYLCQFTGDLEALIKWAQLVAAGDAGRDIPFDMLRIEGDAGWRSGFFGELKGIGGRAEIGWDVARRSHLSPLWINVARPNRPKRLRFLVLMHRAQFSLQRTVICEAMDTKPTNVGFGDSTGLGMDSNETLSTKYSGRWEGLDFTGKSKRELGSLLMTTYDDGAQAIPPTDGQHKFIATDLYALQKEGDMDTLKLTETANPLLAESHCDVAYSNALALKAGQIEFASPHISTW